MAWVTERVDQSGKTRYIGRYRDKRGRKRTAGTFSSRRAAERAGERAEHSPQSARAVDPRRGRQTLQEYIENEWFENHVIERTTRETYSNRIRLYIIPALGTLKLTDIEPKDLREWITAMTLPPYDASPATISKCKTIIDAILTTAYNDQIIPYHPGRGVKTPVVPKKPRKIVTPEQFDRFHDAIPEPAFQLLAETDIESGARWGGAD